MARQGLPRISRADATGSTPKTAAGQPDAEVNATANAVTPEVEAKPGTTLPAAPAGRRRGLPRPTDEGVSSIDSTVAAAQTPETNATVAASSRRRGLPRPAEAGTGVLAVEEPVAAGDTFLVQEPPGQEPVISHEPTTTVEKTAQVRTTGALDKLRAGRLGRIGILSLVLLVLLAAIVLAARWLVTLEPVQGFLTGYPGETELPHSAPEGLPAWLGWQHFFNIFLMVLIIRSGWQVRTQRRPPATWSPRGGKNPKKISINLWLHQSLDILWLANGAIFVVLLLTTGQWMRVVPTSWDVFPNALSAALQYMSLDWPTENGWVNYNSLQVLAYFVTIFIAAPLAAITGFRMAEAWPTKATKLSKMYPVEVARALHLPVMFYFVGFIIVHVALVLSTGALRNLNHMYGGQDVVNWYGFWIFFASLLVIVAGWFAARPLILAPIASLFGKVSR